MFNGLPVGEVTEIDLMEADPRRIEATIRVSQRTPVKTNTHAKLESQGLTGIASLALTGGSPRAEDLKAQPGEELPTIEADQSDLQNLLEAVQNLSKKSDTLLDNANKLIDDNRDSIHNTLQHVEAFTDTLSQNGDNINQTLDNVRVVTGNLKDNKDNIDQILKNASDLSAKLNATATKLDQLIASAQDVIGGNGEAGKGIVDDVRAAAQSFRKLADNLDQRTKEITASVNHIAGPTAHEYEALASDARRSLGELNRVIQSINQNPQQFLFGAKTTIPEYAPGR
ncbi:MlaD family protein [Methylovirgula sp. 4M-Z18]|uniref:MlaD family protein n=1 Tax=Methylovirgula sp. 4M-Z18 TaxID=2293567 RepID=UPI0013149CA6